MKIKSSFKDYYDFVAHQYGGGDPSIVYVRGNIVPPTHAAGALVPGFLKLENVFSCPLRPPSEYNKREGIPATSSRVHAYLVVAGKGYVIVNESLTGKEHQLSDYRVMPPEYVPEKHSNSWWWRKHKTDFWGFEPHQENPFFIALSRQIQHPVFVISRLSPCWSSVGIVIHGQTPMLQEMGMPSWIDPYQMYQQLSMFVGNTMKDPPDTAPPVEVSNKEKILKAGFDLTQSFRHQK